MFKNYLKVAFRNITRHKGFSFINIAGLAVGMTVCILIFLWVQDELSYDKFHKNSPRIHRIALSEDMGGKVGHWVVLAAELAPAVVKEYPEVLAAARTKILGNRVILKGSERLYENGFAFADPSLFEIFSFPLIRGDAREALKDPFSLLISQKMAAKYFGNNDPVGKILNVDNRLDFRITGVLQDIPTNSHLRFDFVAPFTTIKEFGFDIEGWNSWGYPTYLLLDRQAKVNQINEKLNILLKKHSPETKMTLYLQPLNRIHLHSAHILGRGGSGDIRFISIFSIIALFVLLMACINFMNLTTARSGQRAREVGLRKVVGARKKELVSQFFGESLLMSVVSLFLALNLVSLFLPTFNGITGKQLAFNVFNNPSVLLGILAITLFTGLVAGGYPAVVLASIRPSHMLKTRSRSGSGGALFRKILVVFQFFLTVVAIIGTGITYSQLNFIKNQRLGFDKDHIVCIPLKGKLNQNLDSLKQAYASLPEVNAVTAASDLPSEYTASYREEAWEGRRGDEGFLLGFSFVDHDYLETFNMEMKEGRFFTPSKKPDNSKVVINEAAAQAMGMTSPVGKRIGENEVIIGVMKDYHNRSLHRSISPLKLVYRPSRSEYVLLKLNPGDITGTVDKLKQIWNRFAPEFPFQFRFFDDHLNDLYRADRRVAQVFNIFTLIAICVAAMGLVGLASFMAQQRTKEIGIRKALGASVVSIFSLLTKEFTRWVLLANLLAWPVAFMIGRQLLQNYAYRIRIGPSVFLLAGLLSLLIALLSVGYQSVRAARANPVESLRYE